MVHTLGPWHVESTEFPYVLDQDSKVIVKLPLTDQGRTHAQLIAAAPELLEELKYVEGGLQAVGTPWAKERLQFVRAVISKAEG